MLDKAIDLRSDTVTRPTPEMLARMFRAPVGDDVYAEDPSVIELEQITAQLLGKDAALFVPSGTMANQLAIAMHTRPGDSIIAEEGTHCFYYEAGGAAALSGVQFDLLPMTENFSDAAIEQAYKPASMHLASTSLLLVENTHNRGQGRALPLNDLKRITSTAKSLNLATHCDGARLWNAAVATKTSELELAAGFDTVAVCFSKGLGAPVGSALAGTKDLIERARKVRKRWGGGMRQAGYLAAAATYAIEHHRSRLVQDHIHAQILGQMLTQGTADAQSIEVCLPELATNMVYFRLGKRDEDTQLVLNKRAAQQVAELRQAGVLLNTTGGGWLRAVTHLDLSRAHIEQAADILLAYNRRSV